MPRKSKSRFGYFDPETKKFIPDDEVEDLVNKLREQGLEHNWIRPGVDAREIQNAISIHSIIDQRDGMRHRMATGFDEWYAYLGYLKNVQESRKTEKQRLKNRIDELELIVNNRRSIENERHLRLARYHIFVEEERLRLAEEAKKEQEKIRKKLEKAEKERERAKQQLIKQEEKEAKIRQIAEERDGRILARNFMKPRTGGGSSAVRGRKR
jgi:hypothetical protein